MNDLEVFIMAGGKNYFFPGGMRKQSLAVDGVPLIERTVNYARAMWNVEPYVIVDGGQPFGPDMRYFYPSDSSTIVDSLKSTSGKWGHENIVLLGDVYYTQKALDVIRRGNAFAYGAFAEIFGLKFKRGEIVRLMRAIDKAKKEAEAGKTIRLWHVYRAWDGYPVNEHRLGAGYYQFPDGEETQDFDRIEQYQKFVMRRVTA